MSLTDKMEVDKIDKGTVLDGRLRIGDLVEAVNGQKISDLKQFDMNVGSRTMPKIYLTIVTEEILQSLSTEESTEVETESEAESVTGKDTEAGEVTLEPRKEELPEEADKKEERNKPRKVKKKKVSEKEVEKKLEKAEKEEQKVEKEEEVEKVLVKKEAEKVLVEDEKTGKVAEKKVAKKKAEKQAEKKVAKKVEKKAEKEEEKVEKEEKKVVKAEKEKKVVKLEKEAEKIEKKAAEKEVEKKAEEEKKLEGKDTALVVRFEYESGDPLGISLDDKCMVKKIQVGSVLEEKLELGDIIVSANDIPAHSNDRFFELMRYLQGTLVLKISRNKARKDQLQEQLLPGKLESLVVRKHGYAYLLVSVDPMESAEENRKKMGLTFANRQNRVVLTVTTGDSFAGHLFKKYDRICAVNGQPVSDKKVCMKLMRSLEGKFQAVVERPVSEKAIASAEETEKYAEIAEKVRRQQYEWQIPKGIIHKLPDTCSQVRRHIMKRELEKRKAEQTTKKPLDSILTLDKIPTKTVQFDAVHKEVEIVSDLDPLKPLKAVPKL